MQKKIWIVAIAATVALSACLKNDFQRGVAGAAGGAVVSDALGGNPVSGAVVGGVVGATCKDTGLC